MSEDEIEVPIRLTKELADKFGKMKKQELMDRCSTLIVECEMLKLRTKTAIEVSDKYCAKVLKLENKLRKSESDGEQARAMIEAVMEKWHEYPE